MSSVVICFVAAWPTLIQSKSKSGSWSTIQSLSKILNIRYTFKQCWSQYFKTSKTCTESSDNRSQKNHGKQSLLFRLRSGRDGYPGIPWISHNQNHLFFTPSCRFPGFPRSLPLTLNPLPTPQEQCCSRTSSPPAYLPLFYINAVWFLGNIREPPPEFAWISGIFSSKRTPLSCVGVYLDVPLEVRIKW